MRLAIVADWLPTYGGAEHAIAALHALWPDAPIFTTIARCPAPGPLASSDIRTDRTMQRVYKSLKRHQLLLPWMPRAMERMDLRGFDVIVSSSHAVGKGIVPPPHAIHICYCHTPMRYAWEMEAQYLDDFHLKGWLRRRAARELCRLRRWDLSTAKRVDRFIANSTETQERIARIYGRESVVIPPPVDARFFDAPLRSKAAASPRPYLAIGRLVPYKRFDLLVTLANRRGIPLLIAGTGSELPRLRQMAGSTVRFLGYVPDQDLPALYANAEALLFPQHEDAGIVPMEAQACGTPVIAFGRGGVCDVVRDGDTGLLVGEQTPEAFGAAIDRFTRLTFDPSSIRTHARTFHIAQFSQRILQEISAVVAKHRHATLSS